MSTHTETMRVRILALHVLLPLTVGVAIYVLWRSPSLLVFHWLSAIQLLEPVNRLRDLCEPAMHWIPHWCLFSLPDGLWAYSFSSAIILTWQNHNSRIWVLWFAIASSLGLTSELAQYYHVVPGTFESTDLFCYAIGSTIPLLIFMRGRLDEITPHCFRWNTAIVRRIGDR